jgi:hypothetical protein
MLISSNLETESQQTLLHPLLSILKHLFISFFPSSSFQITFIDFRIILVDLYYYLSIYLKLSLYVSNASKPWVFLDEYNVIIFFNILLPADSESCPNVHQKSCFYKVRTVTLVIASTLAILRISLSLSISAVSPK